MFQYSFPPLHSWSVLDKRIGTLTSWVNSRYTQTATFHGLRLHFLAETHLNPSTNCKSMFQHSFPPLLSWSHLIRTNRYSYRWGDHMYPWYRQTATFHVFPLSLFGCKWIPVQQLTPNLCFNIPFHLCIHDLVLDEPIPALTTTIGNGASEYVMFSIWFRRSENLLRMDWLASESNLNCLWNSFWI